MDVKSSCSTLCLRNLLIVDVYEAVWLARDRTWRCFVPDIYSRTESTWVESFCRQSGRQEFDALFKLGFPSAVSYIKKRSKTTRLWFFESSLCWSRTCGSCGSLRTGSHQLWTMVNVAPLLPSSLSIENAVSLPQVMRAFSKLTLALVFSDTVAVSGKLICTELFSDLMHQNTEKDMKNNPVHLITEEDLEQDSILESINISKKDEKDERGRKATEGSGSVGGDGGSNGREYKT
ncbi:E3 UFM1-protein ligase 1-like [Ursus maritimus]|uniref:E3 UFM1-protein ligase 1-like n=1 Tax=Ursus maritimus TaxID=29073 RepID=A0A8M1H0A4_URSMA|nr:E3 UFM1-protein ligase 1-like [Ursus maritimus]